jgi:hypothetical protein
MRCPLSALPSFLVVTYSCSTRAFATNHHAPSFLRLHITALKVSKSLPTKDGSDGKASLYNRRRMFQSIGISLVSLPIAVATIVITPPSSLAADASSQPTIWLSGKPPIVPGKKPRDKNDVAGSRKDPRFLRSIADCKNQCENTPGLDGLSKSKEECLSECQDICCTTYEQCTFAIVPRI